MPESNDKKYEQAMNDVLAIYSQAEQEMLEKVAKRVAKGITTEGWNEQKLSDTQKLNKELSELMQKANKKGKKKIAVEIAKGYLKGKHVTYKETAEIIKSEGFKIGNGKVSGNTWGKAGYFTEKDDVIDFYAGLMTKSKKNKGKETEVINQYIKLGKTKKINLNYGDEDNGSDSSALLGTLKKDMMYLEAAKQLDTDASKYFFENLKGIESELLKIPGNKLYFSKETGKLVDSKNVDPNNLDKYVVKPYYYSKSDEIKKLFNETIKKFKYDTLQIESDNGYVGYDQTIVYNKKSLVSKEEAENVVEEAIENMSYEELLENAPIPMNLKQLVKATNGLIDNATSKILRNANDVYQKVMANGTTGLLSGVDTRIQATQKMLNEYAAKGITSFVDKSGRNWELSSYAEMCARTVSAHAALQGHIDRQLEVGEDLVKVSTIGTTCPICSRWQGVVLSISGKSPKYHSLDEAKASGLFHPNCKHTLGMFIPELDGEGKVEPSSVNPSSKEQQRYKLIEKQRANERKIRYWKKRKSLAITPEEQTKANNKIKYWQYTNLLHCEKNGLRRQYAREGVMKGYSNGPKGTAIGNISNEYSGGSLSDYENMFKDVLGTDPKPLFKMNLQFFASNDVKDYGKWLKDEIHSLDQLDIDKAQMKDSSNKNVTPTSLYKKYIGDNPSQDYAEVSEFEKGTKEYKTGYAKWLKKQIEEIGVSYKVKPQYTEVHEDIPEEDKKLSATEIYKKYHNGKKPTEAYKEVGGEEWTGMKYSKWVETQKKELIKNGITKKVPFGNSTTQKTVDTISNATKTITNAKKSINEDELKQYQEMLDDSVHGNYDGYLKVKEILEEQKKLAMESLDNPDKVSKEDLDLVWKKIELAKAKHLEYVKKKAEKSLNTSSFQNDLDKLKDMYAKEENPLMSEHISSQIDVYEKVKKLPIKKKEALDLLSEIQDDANSHSFTMIKMEMKDAFDEGNIDIADIYAKAYKLKKKSDIFENVDEGYLSLETYENDMQSVLEYYNDIKKNSPGSKAEYVEKVEYEAIKEAVKEYKDKQAKIKKQIENNSKNGGNGVKISIGREVRVNEGHLVKEEDIYNELTLADLENLSKQTPGNSYFKNSNRRDILGRDRNTGRNHHMGHDVRLKSGLSDEETKLGEAFQIAYSEYFNTINCQDINLAYLNGYEKATPQMKNKIDAINKCISSTQLSEPVKLYRYVDENLIKAIFKTTDVDMLEKGSLYDNPTFMSCSTGGHPTFGKRPYMITLECDKGTHALPSLNYEELEVLLGKGKLEFIETKTHTSSKPKKLKNYDGSYTNFEGKEVVVRYIEDGRAHNYQKPTAESIGKIMDKQTKKSPQVKHHVTEEFEVWKSKVTPKEKQGVVTYTGGSYVEMNDNLRESKPKSEKVLDCQAALDKASTDEPVIVRRGIDRYALANMLGFKSDWDKVLEHWDEINEGGYVAEDKAFLSCSPDKKGGFSKPVELRIYCPTGTKLLYCSSISNYTNELESLLQSGSIHRVISLEHCDPYDNPSGASIIANLELLGTD